jgi:hypothetical protein
MSVRNGVVLFLALSALLFLAACGSSSPSAVAPPTGGFTNSNLSGTYTFSTIGLDASGGFFAVAGTFAANGSGGITGGALDVNDQTTGADSANLTISSSSGYSITADGRGSASLNVPGGTIGLDFVLSSSSHGLITRFDGGGSGSGTLDLQGTVSLAGPYTFSLAGADANGSPEVAVGSFTVSGSTLAGVADVNDAASFEYLNQSLSGSITLGSGTAPGTATLTAGPLTFNFDVYTVDSTHLKFVETDTTQILAGDAFTQQTSIPSGQLVFTAAGLDSSGSPSATGGYMTSDGNSMISNGLQDVNDAGSISPAQLTFSGSFTPVSGGRSVFTLNTFYNDGVSSTFTFAAYPSSGGIQLLEIDGDGVTAGTAYAQSSTSFATPAGYGFNVSGSNSGGYEEDDIAEFTASGGNLTGKFDQNDEGSSKSNQTLTTSTYAVDSTNSGRGELVLETSIDEVSGVFYVVSSSNALFLETDSDQVGIGSLGTQGSTAQAAIMLSHFANVHPKGSARAAWRHK